MFNKLQMPSSKTLLFINQKPHNWDPFKILITTCRIICFLLIFAYVVGVGLDSTETETHLFLELMRTETCGQSALQIYSISISKPAETQYNPLFY